MTGRGLNDMSEHMNRLIRKWIGMLMLILSLILTVNVTSTVTYAAGPGNALYTNDETGYSVYIQDNADLLSQEEEEELIPVMQEITRYGNVAFETATTGGASSYDYTVRNYKQTGYFKQSGTLFLIDMTNRQIKIYSDEEHMNKIINDSYSEIITDNIYKYASRGQYFECAQEAFTEIGQVLNGERIAQPLRYITSALLAVILALMINYLLVRNATRNRKASMSEVIGAVSVNTALAGAAAHVYKTVRHQSSSGGGGGFHGGGGGGFSGGGGGGGGFSGGGHSF